MNVLPSPAVLVAFAAAGALLAATPGPDMALFLSRTLGGGRVHGFAAIAGAMTGILIHTCAAALGLSALLAASARAYDAVKLAGAVYLIYLGYQALRHGAALRLEGQGGANGGLSRSYLTGLLINLTNPKIILFFVTFLPQFIEAGDPAASGKFFILGLEFIAIGVAVNSAIILVAARFVSAARANPRAIRWFDYGFAGLMGAFAARLVLAQGR
ncbi:MAG TPA: LysE family translocator [Roseiarcus sp.]|jgi:threonine/homoserine/homoserine lactone efflux protein